MTHKPSASRAAPDRGRKRQKPEGRKLIIVGWGLKGAAQAPLGRRAIYKKITTKNTNSLYASGV
jgi:hypothetical protein